MNGKQAQSAMEIQELAFSREVGGENYFYEVRIVAHLDRKVVVLVRDQTKRKRNELKYFRNQKLLK